MNDMHATPTEALDAAAAAARARGAPLAEGDVVDTPAGPMRYVCRLPSGAAVWEPAGPGDPVTLRGLTGLHAADEALAKGDAAAASRALSDPAAYEAYHARLRGERYQAPVAVAKAEPDHRIRVRKLVADGDMDALTGLMRADPAADRQYREMTWAGELAEAAAEGKTRRAVAAAGSRGPAAIAKRQTPAEVPEAEVAATRRRIRTLLATRDHKGLDAVRRTVAGQAAWIAMALAGEVAS